MTSDGCLPRRRLFEAPALASITVMLAGCGPTGTLMWPASGHIISQFRDGPPARVTGGFGEDSCHACHFGAPENDDTGRILIAGMPPRFTPGATYLLQLVVARPETVVAGFQLTIRNAGDGSQAGRIDVPDDEAGRVGVISERGVQFAQHLLDGIDSDDRDSVRWTVQWTAPESAGAVVVHAAAVAGDGDESQIGDHVYTYAAIVDADTEGSSRTR